MRRILTIASAVVVCAALPYSANARSDDPRNALRDAVAAKVTRVADTGRATQVNVMRSVDGWAFGSAVALAPAKEGAYPDGWLFAARAGKGGWTVAFEGEAAFPGLTAAAPDAVVASHEKRLFASHGVSAVASAKAAAARAAHAHAADQATVGATAGGAGTDATAGPDAGPDAAAPTAVAALAAKPLGAGDYRTGMRLPFAIGQSWRLTGGPHGVARQSIDLAGGDGRVLAPRAGTLYVMCGSGRGWIRVVHDRGYSTDHYHLANNRTDNGAQVAEGAFLGNTGVDVSCGGAATGPHNHFSLRQNAAHIPIAAHDLGKWQTHAGAAEYQGYALHGSQRVDVGGGTLRNHGALGLTQGIVDTNGGGTLNRRAGPGTGYAAVGSLADGVTVSITCSRDGTRHTGRFGYSTAMWNRLTDGSWISDAYTWTGTGNPVAGWC